MTAYVALPLNVWFKSPELSKPLVMDLMFHVAGSDNSVNSFEDENAYHYQEKMGDTPYHMWKSWHVDLDECIDRALLEFEIDEVEETLKLYQLEIIYELKDARGSFYVDNFFLHYK